MQYNLCRMTSFTERDVSEPPPCYFHYSICYSQIAYLYAPHTYSHLILYIWILSSLGQHWRNSSKPSSSALLWKQILYYQLLGKTQVSTETKLNSKLLVSKPLLLSHTELSLEKSTLKVQQLIFVYGHRYGILDQGCKPSSPKRICNQNQAFSVCSYISKGRQFITVSTKIRSDIESMPTWMKAPKYVRKISHFFLSGWEDGSLGKAFVT